MPYEPYKYGELIVNRKYNDILIPNLFYNSIFQPGVTYTDKYQMSNAGQIFVYKLAQQEIRVTTPASDLDHAAVTNELLQLTLNNTYNSSKKIYGVQSSALDFALAAEYMELSAKELAQAWNLSGLACLINEGTGNTIDGYELTEYNLKADLLSSQTELFKRKCSGNTVICSPDFYQKILQTAGTSFTPNINDRIIGSGVVGSWLGMTFINSNLLQGAAGAFEYYNYQSEKQELEAASVGKVDYIMYDPMALSILMNFNESRFINSPDFFGTLIQVEMNSGFRVTNPEAVIVRKSEAAEDNNDDM